VSPSLTGKIYHLAGGLVSIDENPTLSDDLVSEILSAARQIACGQYRRGFHVAMRLQKEDLSALNDLKVDLGTASLLPGCSVVNEITVARINFNSCGNLRIS